MMKKRILLVAVILIACFMLAGCLSEITTASP